MKSTGWLIAVLFICILFVIGLIAIYKLCSWLESIHHEEVDDQKSILENDEYDYGHNVDNHDHDNDC